ncbi:hypothetical protein BC833DRAFT_617067 [Globomyces pollinis-pini]|nr:hypothetical protein BC833DRAFT_617067 [Globomyces pollinis-pini]
MHLYLIPNDILYLITCHLNIQEYHNLNMISKELNLLMIPKLTWKAYLHSTYLVKSNIPFKNIMTPMLDYIDNDRLQRLANHGYFDIVENYLKKFYNGQCCLTLTNESKHAIFYFAVKGNCKSIVNIILGDSSFNPTDYTTDSKLTLTPTTHHTKFSTLTKVNNHIVTSSCLGYDDILKILLIDGRIDPTVFGNFCIRQCSQQGFTSCVELLLGDGRVDPSDENNEAICQASRFGHDKVVELLLSHSSVNPAVSNNLPIRWASEKGHLNCISLLMKDNRVDPSAKDNEALNEAIRYNHWDCVDTLMSDPRVSESESGMWLRNQYQTYHQLMEVDSQVDVF